MDAHPSRLALDRAAFEAPPAEVSAHLAGCEECRAHLSRVQAPPPIPRWVRELPQESSPWQRFKLPSLLGAGALAAAFAVLLVMQPAGYLGEKGGDAAFAVYVERGAQQFIWNGSDKLRPLDRIQLKADTHGYQEVAVGAVDPRGQVKPLYQAPLQSGAHFLPASWILDGAPGPERLVIAFSQERLSPVRLAEAARLQPREKALWASTIELPKETR